MFDFTFKHQLKYLAITNATVTGDAERLSQTISEWDKDSDPIDCCDWPKFGNETSGADFVVTYDASELDSYDAKAIWSCRVDLAALDWERPWEDSAITAAEAVYCQHRAAEPRWVLPHIAADAARFLRHCEVNYTGLTPKDADKLLCWFLNEALPQEAEECDPDPISKLMSEATEDAKPISTGIQQLDAVLGGGLHKGLSILAGDPSAGKTSLSVQAAMFAANKQDGRVVYDMADMGGRRSALLRMISCAAAVAGVGGCKLGRASEWDAREVYEGRQAFDLVTKGRVALTDNKDVTDLLHELDAVEERRLAHVEYEMARDRMDRDNPKDVADCRAKLDRLRELSTPTHFVVLDFAQAMTFEGRALAFDPEAASLAVRELRTWAHDNGSVVLLLSAYSKSASEAHARGVAPQMSDVLGSAELAYSAEHVLALTNAHDGSGKVVVRDLKHRYGSGEPCTLMLDGEHGLFC